MKIPIIDNPFVSPLYQKHWKNYFGKNWKEYNSNTITGVSFLRTGKLPIYSNIGKTNTCGISYKITDCSTPQDKHKVFLLYDVPKYFEIDIESNGYVVHKIPQYKGFAIDLQKFNSVEDYVNSLFKGHRKKSIKKGLRKLEQNHEISVEWYHGTIEMNFFDEIFETLFGFMKERFESMGKENNHGGKRKKNWLKSLFFDLLRNNMAAILVIRDREKPIAISMNYLAKNVFFSTFASFDLDYSKYGLGHILTLNEVEWAISQGFEFLDMAKGSHGYKHKWSTHIYPYEYHIVYKKSSPLAFTIAALLNGYYKCKQIARVLLSR